MEAPAIRPAPSSDVPALSDPARRTWFDAFGDGVSRDAAAAELDERRSETYFADALRAKTILVAEHNGALLGYVEFGDVEIPGVDVEPGDQGLERIMWRLRRRDAAWDAG